MYAFHKRSLIEPSFKFLKMVQTHFGTTLLSPQHPTVVHFSLQCYCKISNIFKFLTFCCSADFQYLHTHL